MHGVDEAGVKELSVGGHPTAESERFGRPGHREVGDLARAATLTSGSRGDGAWSGPVLTGTVYRDWRMIQSRMPGMV